MRTAVFEGGKDHFEDFEEYLEYFHYKFRAVETVRKMLHGILMNTFTFEVIKVKIDFQRRVIVWNGIPDDKSFFEIDWDEDPYLRAEKEKYTKAEDYKATDHDQCSLDLFGGKKKKKVD